MKEQVEYLKHIKNINAKKVYDNKKDIFTNIKNIATSMSIIGLINLLLYVVFTFLVQLYMTRSTDIFDGFRWYHHLIWISIIFVQIIYIIVLVIFPKSVNSLMDGALYDIFTAELIVDGKFKFMKLITIIKNLFKAILVEPFIEYLLIIILMVIPWPFLENMSYMNRIQIILIKIGFFNLLISLICMDYKELRVSTQLDVP
tara:strand:+ start:1436 stop:2038 length:603 start_codon:yes stop_codon:yes gene_type:complete